jgi:hypothetical protein
MAIDYSGQDWRLEDDRLADPCGDEADADATEDVEEFEYDLEWDDDDEAAQHDA